MGTKVYTKQCMYSLKQSHGAVEKNVVYMFSQKNEKERKRKSSSTVCYRFTKEKNETLFWYL